ncbi:hypothetical protein V3C99_015271, partial [Haemonchus contortus]
DGTVTASRRAMEMVIYDFYSDLFDSHVYLSTFQFRQDRYAIPSNLPSEIRHSIASMNECTASGPDRIKPEHLKKLPLFIVRTLARLVRALCAPTSDPFVTPLAELAVVLLYSELFIAIQLVFVRFSASYSG